MYASGGNPDGQRKGGGIDGITFEIDGAGPHTITLGTALPAPSEPVIIDATTQPGYAGTPLIQLAGTSEVGIDISVGETRIRGLAIGGFSVAGIRITGSGKNVVEASYLGVAADGTSAKPNGIGILVEGSPDNIIGTGDEEAEEAQAGRITKAYSEEDFDAGNVISGNAGAGIVLRGSTASGNIVAGNLIGTTAAGDAALPNGAEGVKVDGAAETVIGGNIPEVRNLISGNNGASVWIVGESAMENHISGNFIGTDASGSGAIANMGPGVRITGSPGNTVGGQEQSTRNIVSGNQESGILIEGAASDGNIVAGNFIGTDSAGNTAIPNGAEGVRIMGAPNTRIGTEGLGNVIAGNSGIGIWVNVHITEGHSDGTMILNNIVGLDASGEIPMFNSGEAVIRLDGAARESKIGQANAGNIIAGKENMIGIDLLDFGEGVGAPDGTQVAGNSIGITKSGEKLDEALLFGVSLTVLAEVSGGTQGVIGGEDAASGNRIYGPVVGILVEGEGSSNSVVAYNVIGNMDETLPVEERDAVGIWINGADEMEITSNTIGGQSYGIALGSNESTLTLNKIGTNVAGTAARSNTIGLFIPGEIGPRNFLTGDGNIIGSENGANVISGNINGVLVGGSFDLSTPEEDGAGQSKIKSGGRRVYIKNKPVHRSLANLAVGLPDSLIQKKISKEAALIQTEENGKPDNNIFRLNRIGTNLAGNREIGNGRADNEDEAFAAVRIESGTNNRLIGNLISGNGGGVYVGPDPDFDSFPINTVLAGNIIGGSLASESVVIPNQYGGVFIFNTTGTRLAALPITEGGEPVGNVIKDNGNLGVQIGVIDSEDIGNQVRQSSFFDNDGPSIMLLNQEMEYPGIAPVSPRILSAAALTGNAYLRLLSGTSGIVDGFISEDCQNGHAQGKYSFSFNAEPGVSVVELQYDRLNSSVEDAPNLYMALTITSAAGAGMTSGFSECYRIAREDDIDSTVFSINDEGELINGAGIKVEINSNAEKQSVQQSEVNSSTLNSESMLYVARYRTKPVDGPIDGSAESSDGSMVTPDMASLDRYWSLQSTGIDSISYRVCLDIEDLPGADVPRQLVVLHRRSALQPWKPYDSTLENGLLCAGGLTRFGEIGIGGSGDVNYLPVETVITDLPREFSLSSNYPNPFNPSTIIPYSLSEATHVILSVYDMTGRKTATLINEPMPAGKHEIMFNAGNLASGLYIIRIEAGRFTATQKMMLIK